jgi:hypothetical protein
MAATAALTVGTLSVAAAASTSGRSGLPVGDLSGVGPPYQLTIATEPAASTAAGSHFSLVVTVQDQVGNVVASDNSTVVTLSIDPGTGTLGAAMQCDLDPVTDGSGLASFSCSINTPGSSYQLTATASGLVTAITTPFDIASGTASKLALVGRPPPRWVAGRGTRVKVVVEDASGDIVTTSSSKVSMAISAAANEFRCAVNPVVSVKGQASFGCTMDRSGSSYRLTAASPGLQSAKSTSFAVMSSSAAKLAFARQPPTHARVNGSFSFQVAVDDRFGNLVASSRAAIGVAPIGVRAALLACTANPVRATAGRARFVCRVTHAEHRLLIRARGIRVVAATSTSLSIS